MSFYNAYFAERFGRDPSGKTIRTKCPINKYFEKMGYSPNYLIIYPEGYKNKYTDIVVRREYTGKEVIADLKYEIIETMLASARTFFISGDSYDEIVKNLEMHIQARIDIATKTKEVKVAFGDADTTTVNKDYWYVEGNDYKVKPGINATVAWNDVFKNPSKYSVGCLFAVQAVFQTIVGGNFKGVNTTDKNDWIPGDRGYINNTARSGAFDDGLQGENIIYTGNGGYWGLLDDNPVKSLSEWLKKVTDFDGEKAEVSKQRYYPKVGLDK